MSTAEMLAAKGPTPDSWWSWARVDSLAPLRVVLDGETVALAITPEDHVGGLVVGNRVRMHFHYGRAYVTSKAGGPVSASNPNLIINGRGRINQRGYVTGASLSAGQYCLDRFSANTDGTTVTFTAAPQGQPMTVNAAHYLRQVIEKANLRSGTNAVVISWEGDALASLGVGAFPSPFITSVNGASDFTFYIGSGTFDKLKVEYGITPTPYEEVDIATEVAQCKRYYQRLTSVPPYLSVAAGFQTSTTGFVFVLPLPISMRAAPTLTWSGFYWSDTVNFRIAVSTLYISSVTPEKNVINITGTMPASGTPLSPGVLQTSSIGANGILALDAEM